MSVISQEMQDRNNQEGHDSGGHVKEYACTADVSGALSIVTAYTTICSTMVLVSTSFISNSVPFFSGLLHTSCNMMMAPVRIWRSRSEPDVLATQYQILASQLLIS
jgi:hypothetical protein